MVNSATVICLTSSYCWGGLLQYASAVTAVRSWFQVDKREKSETHKQSLSSEAGCYFLQAKMKRTNKRQN